MVSTARLRLKHSRFLDFPKNIRYIVFKRSEHWNVYRVASTAAHAASASIVALTAAQINPDETGYVVAALIAASILDIDHLAYVIRDWQMYRREGFAGNLHNARSSFHELLGLLAAGIVAGGLWFIDTRLASVVLIAFTVHLLEDWFLGRTIPFAPMDQTLVQYFSLRQKQKVLIDILILTISGGAWILYLSAGS